MEKVFKTLEEQVDLLKNRGLKVEQSDKKILEIENYYNVINGYKDLFLKKKNPDFYKEEASFKEIYALFEFDRKIRMIFLSKILKIEHNIKSLIAYYFSKQYGHNDYFLFENFRIPSKKVSFSKIEEVINVLKDSISKIFDLKNDYLNRLSEEDFTRINKHHIQVCIKRKDIIKKENVTIEEVFL